MAIQTLVVHVGRFLRASFFLAFPLFFGLPIYGVFSAGYFGTACNSTFKQPSTLSAVRLAFVYFVDQGHRPKERFFVLVLSGV